MLKCIKEGSLEWVNDIRGFLGYRCNFEVKTISIKEFLHMIGKVLYIIVAGFVTLSTFIIPVYMLEAYHVHLIIGVPLMILAFIPAGLVGMWFANVWFACNKGDEDEDLG